MKHKKLHLQSLVAVALCLIFSLAFVGCGDDNDEPEDGKLIVGTWVGTIDDVIDDVEVNLSFQYEFKSDGSFLVKQWLTGTAEPSAYQGIGRWSVSNDRLTLGLLDEEPDTFRFSVAGNKLFIYDHEEAGTVVLTRK